MNVMQRSVNHVIKFNATQERLNYEVVSSMHRLEENQADILNRLHAYHGAVRTQTSCFTTGIYSKCTTTIHQIDSKEKRSRSYRN